MSLGLAICPLTLPAQSVTLAWKPGTNAFVTGYIVYAGTNGVNFNIQVNAGSNDVFTMTNLRQGATNYFEVKSHDASNNLSPPSKVISFFVTNINVRPTAVTNAGTNFALLVSGNGSLAPSRTVETFLEGGKYTLTAVPAKGALFAGWFSNGIVVATTARYTFRAGSNVVLQADFVTNPFIAVMGTYHGLFYATTNPAPQSSGAFAATVSSAGIVSARLTLGNQSHAYAAQFSLAGESIKLIARPGLTPITVQLQLGVSNGPMTGTVGDGDWTADLVADPAVYSKINPAPQEGKYTLVIPGSSNSTDLPDGNGFGAVTVNDLGDVTFSGTLGDGTQVSCASTVSSEGQWPLYDSVYGGKGSILGWITFTNDGGIRGQIAWFKPSESTAKLYPGGFTNNPEVVGSSYYYTKGDPVPGFTNGLLVLTSGNLPQSITSLVATVPDKQETNQNSAKLVFNTSSGLFKGSVENPETGKPIAFAGAVLQNQNIGAGFFIGTTESGSVVLSSAQ